MEEIQKVAPWTVIVYDSHSPTGTEIDGYRESFCTKEGAQVYAGAIKLYRPTYRTEIIKEG